MTAAADELLRSSSPLFHHNGSRVDQMPVDTGRWLAAQAALMSFIGRWYDVLVGEGQRPSGHHPDDERLARALELLQPEAVGRNVPHELLREHCGLSQAQLDRLFAVQIGRSPKRLLEERCLARAQELLRDPEQPIKALARALGFTDSAHFGHWFKRACGRTPRAYRLAPDL